MLITPLCALQRNCSSTLGFYRLPSTPNPITVGVIEVTVENRNCLFSPQSLQTSNYTLLYIYWKPLTSNFIFSVHASHLPTGSVIDTQSSAVCVLAVHKCALLHGLERAGTIARVCSPVAPLQTTKALCFANFSRQIITHCRHLTTQTS